MPDAIVTLAQLEVRTVSEREATEKRIALDNIFQNTSANSLIHAGTFLAQIRSVIGGKIVTHKFYVLVLALAAVLTVGCSSTNSTTTAEPNTAQENTTKPAPDNSEIITKVDANGVRTEERVFHGNPRISRVVVTTKDGNRTVKAYSPSGEEKEIDKNEAERVLDATGDKVADAAGFIADKTEDVAGEAKSAGSTAKEKAEQVGEKTVDTAKTVGEKSVEGARTVTDKSVGVAKTVGEKSVSGAKKAGRAVKKIVP